MLETKERKYKREIAELQKENARLYEINRELKESGQTKNQRDYFMKILKENEELKLGASEVIDAVDAIMCEIIDKYGKDDAINISKPKLNPRYKISMEHIGDKTFIRKKLIPEIKS